MNIGQISHAYPPHIGGIENYVCRLKDSLSKMGNDVTIYTTDLGCNYNNVSEMNVNYCKVNLLLLKNPISIELALKLKQSRDDIFHLHGYEFFSTFLATKILQDKPKVLTQHGTVKLNRDLISFLLNGPYHPFLQYILDNMDKIIVLGKKDEIFLHNSFDISANRITIIPNGVDVSKFSSSKISNNNFIKKYGLKENSFKILFVGRLVKQKGAHKLVNVVTEYMNDDNIEVIIIGKGDPNYMKDLTKIRDPRIHFLGEMNFGEDLISAYNVSDLFVILSQFEGLPTTMLEAMASGLPILTTPVGNIPEVIIEGKNGLFIDNPINMKDLAEKLDFFIKSDNARMGNNNKLLIEKKYNWEIISKDILEIYQKVLRHY